MPKYIKHYTQKGYITKYQEKKQRKQKMQFFLKNKKTTANIMHAKIKTRDPINGRAKAYYSFFGLSRHSLKHTFSKKTLPGIILSSW